MNSPWTNGSGCADLILLVSTGKVRIYIHAAWMRIFLNLKKIVDTYGVAVTTAVENPWHSQMRSVVAERDLFEGEIKIIH